jgi:hypothetical protein
LNQREAAKREQALKFRLAESLRAMERLLRFGGWSKNEARAEVHRMQRERREGTR